MIEIDDELACYIHGIVSSDSDSDCDVSKELDEVYNLLKPPPYNYESIKNKIVTISSQSTSNACQDELMNIQTDDEIERIEFVNDVTSKTKKDKNAVQKLNGAQNIEIKFRNKKTNVGKRIVDLYAQFACSKSETDSSLPSKSKAKSKTSKRSQKKEKSKYSTARTYKQRNIVLHEEKHIGLNIRTSEEFVKEFPSVDEVYKDRCCSRRKIITTQPNTLSVKRRKKKRFSPMEKDKIGIVVRREQHNNVSQDEFETAKKKRKIRRRLKQSIKVSLRKDLLEKAGVTNHIILWAQGKKHAKICVPIYIYM